MTAPARRAPLVPVHEQLTLSPQEAADLLGGIGRTKVYELIEAGTLPTITLYDGAGVRITRADLEAYVQQRKRAGQEAMTTHLTLVTPDAAARQRHGR